MTSINDTYQHFLDGKIDFTKTYGFVVDDTELSPIFQPDNPNFKPHQAAVIKWAVKGGRRAIFADFGLGKSVMQLETLRLTLAHAGGRGLIVAPLGVRQEFKHDANELLGFDIKFVRRTEEVSGDGIYITNYESVRDGKLDPSVFTAVTLDEASVLRSFGSKTYQTFLTLFKDVDYRFVATATPNPNRHKELIHYAGYLGVMETGQALTRWFKRDSTKANNLTLHPHKVNEFKLWLASWAVFITKPSDLGFDDEGYALPDLHVAWDEVQTSMATDDTDRDGQGRLFRDSNLGVIQSAHEKRDTISERVNRAVEIVDQYNADGQLDQVIVWCDLNDEQAALEKAFASENITYSSVHGALSVDEVERRITQWKNRETVVLIGKPVQLGQGLNLQQCNKAIFVGITHKFNDTIQAIHRTYRFGQTRDVHTTLIYTVNERGVREDLEEKWKLHDQLRHDMSEIIRRDGLNSDAIFTELHRSMGVTREVEQGDGWFYAHNDCVDEVTNHMDDDSVDLVVTSIPFANHYEYTPAYEDFGHTDNNEHFWHQMDFLTPQLWRVLKPGRIYACHVKDRIQFGAVTGAGIPTVSPFHAEAIFHGIKHGFDYMGMITNVTDVVRENNQTYRLGYTEMRKDGTKMGVGSPEYILLFHKPQSDRTRGYADEPVTKTKNDYSLARWQVDAHAFWRSDGDRTLTPDELAMLPGDKLSKTFTAQTLEHVYDYQRHVETGEALADKGALPSTFMALAPGSPSEDVWTDINQMRNLNGEQARRNVEQHVCPLPFDIVDRLISRYSNEGDLVFDPFGGLGTVPMRALGLNRRGRGVELNPAYFKDALTYLHAEERKQAMPTLFDLLEATA